MPGSSVSGVPGRRGRSGCGKSNRANRRWGVAVALAAISASPTTVFAVPQRILVHGEPADERPTYHVHDTMAITIASAPGGVELTAVASASLRLAFEEEADGMRVVAEIVDFGGSVGNPEMGVQTLDSDDAQGDMVFLVGSKGVTESVSRPELSDDAGQFSLFNQLPHDLFPGLPGGAVEAGDSWSDSAVWRSSAGGMATTSTTNRTYGLVGDTLVDGRPVLEISLHAEVEISGSGSQGGLATSQSIEGIVMGRLLWDPEDRLLHYAELHRDLRGSASMEGRPPGEIALTGPQRIARYRRPANHNPDG